MVQFELNSAMNSEFFLIFSENLFMIRMIQKSFPVFVILICAFTILFSCTTTQIQSTEIEETEIEKTVIEETEVIPNYLSRKLRDTGRLTAPQLAYYFCQMNPEADIIHIINFAFYYIQEAGEEGINSDVAFAQMCLETGYLRFGNLVQPEFHNYCGLGAMDAEHPGEVFETERLGVRAHIQHLHAYATHEDELLNNELIDPRYSWVHKTKYTEDIEGLTGTWATDPRYAEKIEGILQNMEQLFNL